MVCLAGSHRPRLSAFIGLCLLIAGTWLLVPGTTPTYGQDGEGAAPAQTPTTPASGEASASEGRKQKQSLFWHIIYSAGPVFGPMLLVISIILVALIVLLLMDLRLGNAVPPGFVEEFTDTVNKRRFKEAFDLARADSSFLGRVLTAGMGRLQYGIEDAREAALNMVENIKANKEQLITYLATIGTLGPMIGLVGTVYGMILAFMELSTGAQPRPDKLADGISHALVITLLGVAISVPAIFFHAMFKNRVIHIANDVSNIADDLLTQMY
ncbi:MAG: MotA/TolQ/ExbB proton channel family protein, partial [Gemmataceae bacterium]|nr:MotA/TolQ/ExbB proton channel family protein [Gemmataceae bacterium]MDW8264026.1 MotA/TolQ/ExbB proton channel family protein [Gemmataceae bacterium]